jgi:hypothetical protein
MTDIAELIRADHVRISRMIGQLSSALAQLYPADTGLEAGPAWDSLAGLLRLHVAAAEEIAYLALASAYPGAALAMTQASEVNADICAANEEARLYRSGSRAWKMAVQAACRLGVTACWGRAIRRLVPGHEKARARQDRVIEPRKSEPGVHAAPNGGYSRAQC